MTKEVYYISWNEYMEMEEFEGNLEAAQTYADENAAYTQQPIIIYDADNNEICRRDWSPTSVSTDYDYLFFEENQINPCFDEYDKAAYDTYIENYISENNLISFGDFGYFNDWQ